MDHSGTPEAPVPSVEAPDVTTEVINACLNELRDEIEEERVVVVIELEGLEPKAVCTYADPKEVPRIMGDRTFFGRVRRLWKRYDQEGVVPIVVTRTDPTAFMGLKVATVPWAPSGCEWCLACGARVGTTPHTC
jgi:hypothetical protein